MNASGFGDAPIGEAMGDHLHGFRKAEESVVAFAEFAHLFMGTGVEQEFEIVRVVAHGGEELSVLLVGRLFSGKDAVL